MTCGRLARRRAERDRGPARALGQRKDHDPAPGRPGSKHRTRARSSSGPRTSRAVRRRAPPLRDGLSALCPLPAHDGRARTSPSALEAQRGLPAEQRRLRVADGARAPRCSTSRAFRASRTGGHAAFRRPAAARRAGAGPRAAPARPPARRAALQSGSDAAREDPPGAEAPDPPHRDHDALRDPRAGGSLRAGRPRGGPQRGRLEQVANTRGALREPGDALRGDLHRPLERPARRWRAARAEAELPQAPLWRGGPESPSPTATRSISSCGPEASR